MFIYLHLASLGMRKFPQILPAKPLDSHLCLPVVNDDAFDPSNQLANASEDTSSVMDEKNAAIREAARLKIQLDALKPDYEAECVRSENSRREKVKISKELSEVKAALDDALAEAVSQFIASRNLHLRFDVSCSQVILF
jgi:hypothetical protein